VIFFDTQVLLYSRDGINVQWRLDPQELDPTTLEIEVQRSESPVGPWATLATVDIMRTFSFFDKTAPWRSNHVPMTYRLRAVLKSDGSVKATSKAFTFGSPLPLDAIEIIRQQRVLLEGVNGHTPEKGTKCSVYKRRNFGENCKRCRDAITGRITVSNCQNCFGTGKVDGFYDGIDIFMNLSPHDSDVRLDGLQKVEEHDSVFYANNFPVFYSGDIVVEPTEQHWRIVRMQPRERRGALVRQILFVTNVKPDDIIHDRLRHSMHGGKQT
jgi:hypothetical protein